MSDWFQQLRHADGLAEKGQATEAFCAAFCALELCFVQAVRKFRSTDGRIQDDRFLQIARLLHDKAILREDEFALAKHLADARNLISHKYRFEPSIGEARRTIERVGGLCQRFARKVSDAMKKPVVTALPTQRIGDFIRYFVHHGYSSIPVVSEQNVIGTLNESAVLIAWQHGEGLLDPSTTIQTLMSAAILPDISPNATVEEARKAMIGNGASALLVLHSGLPIGILTKFDLLGFAETLL
jgi:predicted transcriptional regulator